MKSALKHVLLNALTILIASRLLPGITYQDNIKTLIFAAIIISLLNLLVKPILKIIFLPLNLITFGIAGWFIQVITLYLATILVDGFSIEAYTIGPIEILGIAVPKIHFSGFWAYVGSAFVLSFISSFLYWIL